MTKTTTEAIRAQVFDGRGTATIWTVRETRTGTVFIESVGTVCGVHTEAEAITAWKTEQTHTT